MDDHFHAGKDVVKLVETVRRSAAQSVATIGGTNFLETTGSLARVFQKVGRGLLGYLTRDDQGKPVGWRHNLQTGRHVTALSTAYGIKTMLLVGDPYIDLHALAESLLDMRTGPSGLWLGRSGSPRPETTAAVLDALFRVGGPLSVDEAMDLARRSLDDVSRTRPYVLAAVLQTVLRLRPDGPLATELVDDLLAARLEFDGHLLWPEKNEPGLAKPEPSAVHTARGSSHCVGSRAGATWATPSARRSRGWSG